MKGLKLLTLFLIPSFLFAQGPIYDKIQDAKSRSTSTEFNLVKSFNTDLRSSDIPAEELMEGLTFELDYAQINELIDNNPELIRLSFPLPDQSTVTVDLVENKVLANDFIFRKSSSEREISRYAPGKYYHGVISDDPTSLVAISVFENEIVGLISTSRGNYVIGKLKNDINNKHIIYNDLDLINSFDLDCGMEDDGVVYTQDQLTYVDGSRDIGDCIRIYIEIDDDIVTDKGGVTPATNYITGLFNEVFTIYANSELSLVISEIKAWDTPSPYSGDFAFEMLFSYQANTGTFNGDLSHLVSYQASGGTSAGFDGICNPDPDRSKCFSSIDATYNTVPTYSWSVYVCTHEMGHLIGARHTHGCVWNGNGTAIDGCGNIEGSCPDPGFPPGGSTIMSYCSANFEFNPQVQSVLLWTTANADCLSACGGPESCHDGIQNGDETEIDCGGTLCDPCPTCSDNVQNGKETEVDCGGPFCPPCPCIGGENISISITLNTFVSTTWGIADANNIIVAQGGTYGVPGGSTVTEVVCLDYGCYDFTIYNTFGSGSYTVTDENNTVLASGVNLNETTNFCLIQPTCSITSSLSKTDETVQGANDGTITVTASCTGTCGTLQYSLNGGTPQASNVFAGLAPGMYAVETSNVGDATCNDFREITIIEGDAPPLGDVYVLVATDDDLEFDECVAHSGGIGIMSAGDEAEIEDNAVVTAAGTFVKAPEIDVDNSSVVTVQIEEQADPILPIFRYNNTNPGYDLEINVDDGETVILTESLYEDIKVGDDATIIFSGQSDVYIEDLETEDDVTILFDQCTNLMLSGDLELGKDNNFNASGTMDVIVFAEKKIKIKKRADVYGTLFALKKFETKKSSSSHTSKFHGLFIGKEIEANEHGEYWAQSFNPECAPPPLQPNGPDAAMQENPNPAKEKKSVQPVGLLNKVDFSLYPNPAKDQVHILVKSEIEKAAIIRIFNMQGKLMASREFEILDDGRITFDLNQFAPGMYTVMISIDGNVPATKKFVVQ